MFVANKVYFVLVFTAFCLSAIATAFSFSKTFLSLITVAREKYLYMFSPLVEDIFPSDSNFLSVDAETLKRLAAWEIPMFEVSFEALFFVF